MVSGECLSKGGNKVTGTLQVKRGKYFCVLDYRDENGARKFKWISTGLEEKGNKRKATEMLNKVLMEYELKNFEVKTTGEQNNHPVPHLPFVLKYPVHIQLYHPSSLLA